MKKKDGSHHYSKHMHGGKTLRPPCICCVMNMEDDVRYIILEWKKRANGREDQLKIGF